MTADQAQQLIVQQQETNKLLSALVQQQGSVSAELAALRLAPSLIRLVVILLIVGLLAIGVVGAAKVNVKGFGLEGGVIPMIGLP